MHLFFRLKNSETKVFFEVDSNHFRFEIANEEDEFSASTWGPQENRVYIPLSSFDANNELLVQYESSILGIYTVKFYTDELNLKGTKDLVKNGRYVVLLRTMIKVELKHNLIQMAELKCSLYYVLKS